MKLFFLCIVVLAVSISCSKGYKDAADDGKADGRIRGRLFLLDTLTTHKVFVPLSSKVVTIFYQESTDTVNYLFATPTDKDGYFSFSNLDKTKTYRVYYEERGDSDRTYTGNRLNIKPDFDTLALNAYLNLGRENGFLYTILDTNRNPVKGVNVCIFKGNTFFQPGKCDNSNYRLTTDDYGHAFKFTVPQGPYYVSAYIQANGAQFIVNDTVTMLANKQIRSLTLKKTVPTEYNYLVRDTLGNALPYATLCFFSSPQSYNSEDCSIANISKTSGQDGKVKVTELSEGSYYVLGKLQSASLSLKGRDFIHIVADKIVYDTIDLK